MRFLTGIWTSFEKPEVLQHYKVHYHSPYWHFCLCKLILKCSILWGLIIYSKVMNSSRIPLEILCSTWEGKEKKQHVPEPVNVLPLGSRFKRNGPSGVETTRLSYSPNVLIKISKPGATQSISAASSYTYHSSKQLSALVRNGPQFSSCWGWHSIE